MAKKSVISRNRIRAINDSQKNAIEDLQSNGVNIMVTPPVYIHNTMENFITAAKQANGVLSSYYNEIKTQWESEAEYLKQQCITKEANFFSNPILVKLGINNRKQFEDMFLVQFSLTGKLDYRLDLTLPDVPKGTKSVSQIRKIADFIIDLNNKINNVSIQPNQDGVDLYVRRLAELKNIAEDFKNKYNYESDSTTDKNGQKLEHVKELSLKKLMVDIIPGALERLYFDVFKEIGLGAIKTKYVAASTGEGTTADLRFGNASFSIKNNSKEIKQSKNRILDTFFDWNNNISNELSSVQNLMTTQFANEGYSLNTILQYILLNYGSFVSINDTNILEETMKIIILTNLNEKMFGYNKAAHADMNFKAILNTMPVAGLDNTGKIIWYADIMGGLIDKIKNDTISMKNLATAKITPGSYNRNALYQAKQDAIKNNGGGVVTYQWLKSKIKSALKTAETELAKSIHVSIQYHLNIAKILKEKK